jgi:hypothetical protein
MRAEIFFNKPVFHSNNYNTRLFFSVLLYLHERKMIPNVKQLTVRSMSIQKVNFINFILLLLCTS